MAKSTPQKLDANDLPEQSPAKKARRHWWMPIFPVLLVVVFILTSHPPVQNPEKFSTTAEPPDDPTPNSVQIFPEQSVALPFQLGMIGPKLISTGVLSPDLLKYALYRSGLHLTSDHSAILDGSFGSYPTINFENANFFLNFFWALGLVNENPILSDGIMFELSEGSIERFASTGGYRLTRESITNLYSSSPILELTDEQQQRIEKAAELIFRPCCNNAVIFPDCNHGMAMLGVLELMASQDASVDTMLRTAKDLHAFWFPQQTLEQAVYFSMVEGKDISEVEPERILGAIFSSASGFADLRKFLKQNQWIPEEINPGGSC